MKEYFPGSISRSPLKGLFELKAQSPQADFLHGQSAHKSLHQGSWVIWLGSLNYTLEVKHDDKTVGRTQEQTVSHLYRCVS